MTLSHRPAKKDFPSLSSSPNSTLTRNATHQFRLPYSIMSKHTTVTPPESFADLPPTPPPSSEPKQSDQVGNILKHLRLRKVGHSVAQPWTAFHLDSAGFQQLLAIIRADESLQSLFENEIRYEGDPKALPVVSPC